MKVICVIPITIIAESCKNKTRPQVGDIDEVIRSEHFKGHLYYSLERFGRDVGFLAECFAQLSDIDETELINEREQVIA
jgi:hypothetical protein